MNKEILIYQHLGLGDHIICNGLVRNIIKNDKTYKMFVFNKYYESVSFMFSDVENLSFIPINSDGEVGNFINEHKNLELIKIGTTIEFFTGPFDTQFDEMFYNQHNIPFNKRWDDFKVIRDEKREYNLFKKYFINENEYIFIHDDIERNFHLREENIDISTYKVVRPNISFSNNIFDYCYLMENAKECHFIDSSFKVLFDSISKRETNIFHHLNLKYGHRSPTYTNSKLKFKIFN